MVSLLGDQKKTCMYIKRKGFSLPLPAIVRTDERARADEAGPGRQIKNGGAESKSGVGGREPAASEC